MTRRITIRRRDGTITELDDDDDLPADVCADLIHGRATIIAADPPPGDDDA